MSKKKLDLTRDLTRGRSIKKEIGTTEAAAAKVVEKVNKEPAPKEVEKSRALIRTTIDLPAYIHKAIKIKAATEGISLKKYLVSLVKSDLDLD